MGALKTTGLTILLIVLLMMVIVSSLAFGRDDGRYAGSPLKPWFDKLKSGKGLCCSDADGTALSNVDWDSRDGHYRVRIDGRWLDVPDDALISEPNRAGIAMVWPIRLDNEIVIRCFMPGALT